MEPHHYTSVELDGDTDAFTQNLFSQHYAMAYGDMRAELRQLCRMSNISVVE